MTRLSDALKFSQFDDKAFVSCVIARQQACRANIIEGTKQSCPSPHFGKIASVGFLSTADNSCLAMTQDA